MKSENQPYFPCLTDTRTLELARLPISHHRSHIFSCVLHVCCFLSVHFLQVSFPCLLGTAYRVLKSGHFALKYTDSLESSQGKRKIHIHQEIRTRHLTKRSSFCFLRITCHQQEGIYLMMCLIHVTILPSYLLHQLLCLTFSDCNHKLQLQLGRDLNLPPQLFFRCGAICELCQHFHVLFYFAAYLSFLFISVQALRKLSD